MTKNSSSIETLVGIITLVFVIGVMWYFSQEYFKNKPSNFQKYNHYIAKFNDIEGLSVGANVKIGGITIGKVIDSIIEQESYKINVKFSVIDKYKIPQDSIISVSTNGIIGEKYLKLSIGNSDEFLKNNDEIELTQSSLGLENLISLLKK